MYTLLYIVGVAGTFLQPVMVVAAWGFGLGAFVRAFSRPKSISKAISPSKWLILPLWIFTSGVALAALGLQIRLLIASSV
ncbi:MAG: hypothetical protein EA397_01220 [Deltaproteobacteria bacterium]|nr:MAG: hypothetical protein EA397_01220 [Deltaproteobacteria bacterium]